MTETRICLYCCRERPSFALRQEPGFYVVWRCRDEEDCRAVRVESCTHRAWVAAEGKGGRP